MKHPEPNTLGGRPHGDVRQALLKAVAELATQDQGPTLREMAQRACVGLDAARRTVSNLKRCRALVIARERRVAYRNRPVAEYALPCMHMTASPTSEFDFSSLTSVW